MKQIRRMKILNALITSILLAAGIACWLLEILHLTGFTEEYLQDAYVMIIGFGLLVAAWMLYVVNSFLIEWAENTYAIRLSYEDMRKSDSQPAVAGAELMWSSSRSLSELPQVSEVNLPKPTLDMKLVQDVMNSHANQSRASQYTSEADLAFDQGLQRLATGVAVENEKYKLQKYRDGKIIIGHKTTGHATKYEYLQHSKVIAELHQLRWIVTDKEAEVLWK